MNLFRKVMVITIIGLFCGAGVYPCMSMQITEHYQIMNTCTPPQTCQIYDDVFDLERDLIDKESNPRFISNSAVSDWHTYQTVNDMVRSSFFRKIQTEPDYDAIIESLDEIIHPLNNRPLELPDDTLEVLRYLGDAKIVGLGEATHGTKEFFELKHRIFRYLVEHHGFNVFAFECDMGESYYVNKFVTQGIGDIDEIMKNIMLFWTWRTKEVKELLLWIRDYNIDKSEEDLIHFIGVDCQSLNYQAEIIFSYFNETNITLSRESIQFLQKIDRIGKDIWSYYLDMTIDEKVAIDQNVDMVLTEIIALRNELIDASSEFEYTFIKQLTVNIKQVNDVYYAMTHSDPTNYRDLYMAENSLWVSELFGEDTKVAVWAHNAHVANWESFGSIGFHLKQEIQDAYQIIGFSFALGSFTAVRMPLLGLITTLLTPIRIWSEPIKGSVNYIFHHAQYDNFIVRSSDIQPPSDFATYISQSQGFITIGAGFNRVTHLLGGYYLNTELMEEYDVIIHWDETEAAEQLPR